MPWQASRRHVESRIGGVQYQGRPLHQGLEPVPKAAGTEAEEISFPRARTILAEVETGIDETPWHSQIRPQPICRAHTEQRTEQDHRFTRLDRRTHSRRAYLSPLHQRIRRFRADLNAARSQLLEDQADIALLEGGRDTDG